MITVKLLSALLVKYGIVDEDAVNQNAEHYDGGFTLSGIAKIVEELSKEKP